MRRGVILLGLALLAPCAAVAQDTPLEAVARFDGWRQNALIGYGIVTGLAGTGDTRRSEVTRQALHNVLSRLGANVGEAQISSRNVAVVVVIATLPPSANPGDRIDAVVTSIGDARSLAGGALLMTPLLGPDQRPYALAQGALTVGGHDFEANLNRQQRNYPTTAVLPGGATVETAVDAQILKPNGELSLLLGEPSFTTATRVMEAINRSGSGGIAYVRNADEVAVRYAGSREALPAFIARIENLRIAPDTVARIVINERTGTVVAGADVRIASVVISQGDIRVTVRTENAASQPGFVGGFAGDMPSGGQSLIVTNTRLDVDEGKDDVVGRFPDTTVGDLVQGLARSRVGTRRMIAILQAIKAAGALHADIVVQ